jgi:Helix-turn-helix domain
VPDHGSLAVRRRRLAAELRRLREHAGFLGEEAATRLGWSASKLSRIETGKTGIKLDDLRLPDLYLVSERSTGPRREVVGIAESAWSRCECSQHGPALRSSTLVPSLRRPWVSLS